MDETIENLMVKLDNEKRESEFLDDQIRTLEASFASLKLSKRADSPKKNPLITKASLLEKQIENEIAQYDSLKNENSEIRKEVDKYRIENSARKKSLSSLKALIQTSSYKILKLNELNKSKITKVISNQTRISEIRSRSVAQKEELKLKIRNLSSMMQQRSQIQTDDKNNERLQELLNNLKGCNLFNIQSVLTKKWQDIIIRKQEELNLYEKHVARIEAGFEEIRTALGVREIPEIVKSFIRSEEQSQELYKYLCSLNADIDSVQETLSSNNENIQKFLDSKGNEQKNLERLDTVKSRLAAVKTRLEETEKKNSDIQTANFSSLESLKIISKKLQSFSPQLQGFLETTDFSSSDLPKFLKLLDRVTENISASFTQKYLTRSKEMSSNVLSQLLEENDLYDDPEIQDSRVPMYSSYFLEKANKIVKPNN